MCAQLLSLFIKECNKVSNASAYCIALAHRMTAADNNCKRWWLTRRKTKVTAIHNCIELLHGDSIASMPCTLAFRDTYIIKHKPIFCSLPQRRNFPPLPHVAEQARHASCTCARSDTITQGFLVN